METNMCRIAPLLMFFVCLLLLAGAPRAAGPSSLYAAEVPVADDSPAQRNQGFANALARVMVGLSGDLGVGNNTGAKSVLGQASSLVQQFRYRMQQVPDTQDSSGSVQQKRYLWAKFDKMALDGLLRKAGIPVWDNQRPRVLLWLAVEKSGQRYLSDLEADTASHTLLRRQAEFRGMPLQFPLVDLQDQTQLSVADVWADYATAIQQASQRYPHDVVLTGRLRHLADDMWAATWALFDADDVETYATQASPWPNLLVQGIDGAQNRLAAKYAPTATASAAQSGALLVRFTQVGSLAAYARLRQILKKQAGLVRYSVQEVKNDELLIKLWAHGGPSTVSRNLTLTGELFALGTAANASPSGLAFSLLHGAAR